MEMNAGGLQKRTSFHHNCLRQICNIFWPNTITNTILLQMTNSKCIIDEVTQKRFRWLGHVLRMEGASITKTALSWTPQGKRPVGRPKQKTKKSTTWRRTVEGEIKDLKMTWGEAENKTKNRAEWRGRVSTLCSTWSEEDKYVSKVKANYCSHLLFNISNYRYIKLYPTADIV